MTVPVKQLTLITTVMVVCFVMTGAAVAYTPAAQSEPDLSEEALANAEYPSEWAAEGVAQLTDGSFTEPYGDGSAAELTVTLAETIAYGDLNGDGLDDAVVVLVTDPGGSGTFFDIAAVLNDKGQPQPVASKTLGDRIEIKSITIDSGEISVDMVSHGPQDPQCCPSLETTRTFTLQADKLVQAGKLVPYSSDGQLYGYVDLAGDWIVEPQFNFADAFSEDVAVVNVDDLYGYIDRTGAFIIEPQFNFAYPFVDGLAAVSLDQKAGYIDQSGAFVIEPQFDFANSFSEGLALIGLNGKSGFIDKSGTIVIEPQFDFAFDFTEGLAVVEVDEQFGYIDSTGAVVIEPQFDFANNFSEGLAAVAQDNKTGYIDQSGAFVIKPEWEQGFPFAEGLAFVDDGERRGYIDQTGAFVIDNPAITFGDTFAEGLAAVEIDGQFGYINTDGDIVIEPKFVSAGAFENGLAFVWFDSTWGYIDQTGHFLFQLPVTDLASNSFTTSVIDFLPAVPPEVKSGSCFANSSITLIDSAWRCTVGNEIFDPCLVADDGETLVCGANPILAEAGFQLELTEPLPEPDLPTEIAADDQRLTLEALSNIEYPSEWTKDGVAPLADGEYSEPFDESVSSEIWVGLVEDLVVYGDVNDDGLEDAVVVLTTSSGGTGVFYALYAVINDEGEPKPVASTMLGDRVIINSIAINRGEITVEMITQRPNDGMCCPTLPVTLQFVLEDDTLLSSTTAWLMELADGSYCSFATGATGLVEKKRVNFFCSDDGAIIGGLQVGPVWSAEKVIFDEEANDPFAIKERNSVDILSVWQPVNPAAVSAKIGLTIADVSLDLGDVAKSIQGQLIPTNPYNPNVPPQLNGSPAHIRFAFDEEVLPTWGSVYLNSPQLLIYPVDDYLAMYEATASTAVAERIDALQTLLDDRPETIDEAIPVLPGLGDAVQDLRVQIAYLEFEQGQGIRFVTHYAQDANPIINETVFYTFQGLTNDGQFYVALYYPVSTAALPDSFDETEAADDYDAFLENFETYLQETHDSLNGLDPADFSPDLTDLDSLVKSLVIKP
ncbi:MAG: WG repeat-containing protein [Anaerolineae bacterium]|nr:WG repeat-containing protein [Anaerolineae bacterium]